MTGSRNPMKVNYLKTGQPIRCDECGQIIKWVRECGCKPSSKEKLAAVDRRAAISQIYSIAASAYGALRNPLIPEEDSRDELEEALSDIMQLSTEAAAPEAERAES